MQKKHSTSSQSSAASLKRPPSKVEIAQIESLDDEINREIENQMGIEHYIDDDQDPKIEDEPLPREEMKFDYVERQ